jgi:predicted nucleic-acid-binding protein
LPQLDANVLLRHLLADNAAQSPRANALIGRLEAGDIQLDISDMAIHEVVFTLERSYKREKRYIRKSLEEVLGLSAVSLSSRDRIAITFEIYEQLNADFGDAYIAALAMESDGQVISFDRGFDRIPGVTRVEP